MRPLIILLLLFSPVLSLFSSQVTISGFSGGNSKSEVELFSYSDPLSRREILISRVMPDQDGRFKYVYDNEGITELFIRNGIHDNYFFIDGENDIELILYPFTALSAAEEQNPFFKHLKVHCASSNKDDLNNLILRFDIRYFDIYDELVRAAMGEITISDQDSIVNPLMESTLMGYGNFYNNWVRSRLASLKVMLMRNQDSRIEIIRDNEEAFDPFNRASVELVNSVSSHLLRELSVISGGEIVRAAISGEHRFPDLRDFVVSETGFSNQRMVEFILISNLFTEYYSNYFKRESIFNLLRWIANNGTFEFSRTLALEISGRIARFLPGSPLPGFNLKGQDGGLYTAESWPGKYIIITFGKSDSWATLSEYNLLRGWYKEYNKYVEIVTILCDDDYTDGAEKMAQNGFEWIMLDASGSSLITDNYEVDYFPSFFLADSEGKIIKAHAPPPSENLIQILLEKLQPYLINNIPER